MSSITELSVIGSTELNILKHEQIFIKPEFCVTSTALSNAPISAACLDVTQTAWYDP